MSHASATNDGRRAGETGTKLDTSNMSSADRNTALAAQKAAQEAAARRN